MVAPTRAPEARGVKCDLCKKILICATWLDQTKLAKSIKDAQVVLGLTEQHGRSDCPCMPKSIENLLVGSTHFEIHRIAIKRLDTIIQKEHQEVFLEMRRKDSNEKMKNKNSVINDCDEPSAYSRFKLFHIRNVPIHSQDTALHLQHLILAIDYWKLALEDQSCPFNSKLALRLGLTHHAIYACYLFKFYKILDYQLTTANLVLNLFRSIDGVTTNAVLHASFLVIKSLLDSDQYVLARQFLKQAAKLTNYQDKNHYESILLACVDCELDLLEKSNYAGLDDLANLSIIQPNDKLQHYYARTLALSTVIRYIHHYMARSDLCFEYHHTFRYLCAIIRRCYESSFELVLASKDDSIQISQSSTQKDQVVDHSWIKFAICDFVFSTFDLIVDFYIRAGHPESLELLYNGLSLIAHRSGSLYWQARIASIGAHLDLICDKYKHSSSKLDAISILINQSKDFYLMNVIRLDQEISLLSALERQGSVIKGEMLIDILHRVRACKDLLQERIFSLELYDCKLNFSHKLINSSDKDDSFIVFRGILGNLSFKSMKLIILSLTKKDDELAARDLIKNLVNQLEPIQNYTLEFRVWQSLLETLLCFSGVQYSELQLLESVKSCRYFLKPKLDTILTLQSQLSNLNITSHISKARSAKIHDQKPIKTRQKRSQTAIGKRKGVYDVISESEKNLPDLISSQRYCPIDSLIKLQSLSKEDIVSYYLRHSDPSPDYLLYRKAHEILMSLRLKDEVPNHDLLLFHFCESSASNTIRYRWMMFEEQQVSSFESKSTEFKNPCSLRHLGFSNSLKNTEKLLKSWRKTISCEYKLVQLKYIFDENLEYEHLLCVSFDNESSPIYIDVSRPLISDSIIDVHEKLSILDKLSYKISESKKTLFFTNQRSRSEARQKIETDIGILLHDLENEWFGSSRFLLCGRVIDKSYDEFIHKVVREIQSIMIEHSCISESTLFTVVENAPLLSREEFCQLISSIFNCAPSVKGPRDCFNKWSKMMEVYVHELDPKLNRVAYLQSLHRGQVGLILDGHLELVPFESIPILRVLKQAVFRVPSLRLFSIMVNRARCSTASSIPTLDVDSTAYLLDPANNLPKTRDIFERKLRARRWCGCIGQAPSTGQLEAWLTTKQIYLFIGHGAGTQYYQTVCKGRGLSAMSCIRPVSIVMGCSSGRVTTEGPRLESFGIGWLFVLRGATTYVGLLWDVTDTDIDKFLDNMLEKWIGSDWISGGEDKELAIGDKIIGLSITEAVAQARHVCQRKLLIGSAPIVYGLPVRCQPSSKASSDN